MAGWEENRALLLFDTMKLSVCPASSAGPALMAVAQPAALCAPVSSATVWSAPFVKLGASLTATTVILKLCGAEASMPPLASPPESCRTTVKLASPLASAAGV